jgi:sec-independent protein translocase protein TatB
MFDIGWGELVVIGIVALIAIGPKELPTVLRTLGQFMGKVRRMASEFQGQFQESAFVLPEEGTASEPSTDTASAVPAPLPEPPQAQQAQEVNVPLPEPPSPVSEKDFAPAEVPPPKQAGGGG